MRIFQYYIQLLLLIILVTSCNNISEKSLENLKNMNQLKVEIDISNALETPTIDDIKITLYDADDKLIGNDSLSVLMNNRPMGLYGNYRGYNRYNRYYQLREQEPEKTYQFTLMFPDSSYFNLGSITPKPTELNKRLTIANQINKLEDRVVSWNDLSHHTHIDLQMHYVDSVTSNKNHYKYKTKRIDVVSAKQMQKGMFALSKEQLRDSSLVLRDIKCTVYEKYNGLLLQNLREGSTCYFTNTLTKTINVISN